MRASVSEASYHFRGFQGRSPFKIGPERRRGAPVRPPPTGEPERKRRRTGQRKERKRRRKRAQAGDQREQLASARVIQPPPPATEAPDDRRPAPTAEGEAGEQRRPRKRPTKPREQRAEPRGADGASADGRRTAASALWGAAEVEAQPPAATPPTKPASRKRAGNVKGR